MIRSLGLALAVLALATACSPNGDTANVSISLGKNVQRALSANGVTISTFQLDIACIDGRVDSVRGDVDDNGNFSINVPRCPQATVRFSGLAPGNKPALLGTTSAPIQPPTTELVFDAIRVGTVTIQNDAGYASVCEVATPEDTTLAARFELDPGAEKTLVLPVVNTTLACIPKTDCADVGTCVVTASAAAQVRTLAVPWGDVGTVSLQNLSSTLVFATAPAAQAVAGAAWSPFTVQLLDDSRQPIDRSDITVSLIASTSTVNGGFTGGDSVVLDHGSATFGSASFATAGSLTLTATANVNGLLLSTDPVVVSILADAVALLHIDGPSTIAAGQTLVVTVTAFDKFNNPANLPPVDLSSSDPQTHPVRLNEAVNGVAVALTNDAQSFNGDSGFALYTAGPVTVTATDANNPAITATLNVTVTGGPAATLFLTSDSTTYVQNATATFTAKVADTYGNPTPTPGLTITLEINGAPGPTYTYTSSDGGVGQLLYAFASAGQYTVDVTGGAYTSNALTIQVDPPGTTVGFSIVPQDPFVVAGAGSQVLVTALGADGMPNPNDSSVFTLFTSDPQVSSIPAQFTNGSVSINIPWKTVGQQTATAVGEFTVTSPPVTVTASTANGTRIVLQPPGEVIVGQMFSIGVIIEDAWGNATDPRLYTFGVNALGGAGTELNGSYVLSARGNTMFIDQLSFNAQLADAQLSITTNVPAATATSTFQVVQPAACPIAYVRSGAVGDGCSLTSPAPSIAALAAIPSGVPTIINIAAGTYAEQIVASGVRTYLGGWDAAFSARTPLQTPTIIAPASGQYAVDVVQSADVVLDGLYILAADLTASGTSFAGLVESGASVRVRHCVLSGPYNATDGEGGVWDVNDPVLAVFESNWIATGGLQSGSASAYPRHGIRALGGSGVVSVVSNTFVMADSAMTAAVEMAGAGDWSVTDNLIVADFTNCAEFSGVCALADQNDGASIGSVMHNVIFGTQTTAAPVYRDTGSVLADPNEHRGNFSANQVVFNQGDANTLFQGLTGGDGHLYTMVDNNWHVSGFGKFTAGVINTGSNCGASGQAFCGGQGFDIDGDLYATGVGADGP